MSADMWETFPVTFCLLCSRTETLKRALQGKVSLSLDYEENLFASQVRPPEPDPPSLRFKFLLIELFSDVDNALFAVSRCV